MKNSILLIFLLSVVLFQTCEDKDEITEDKELLGNKWKLVKHIGQAGYTVPTDVISEPGEEYWIRLDSDGKITAQDACNTCSGTFEFLDNNLLQLDNFACTEIACPGVSRLALNSTFSHSITNDTLTLIDEYSFSWQLFQFITE